jgi:Fe-S-cluster containining protein
MHFPEKVTRLCGSRKFSFRCHPEVSCFTECCRELELALTPYDVLRLRQKLTLGAQDFIDRYVVIEQDEDDVFPRLYLGMVDDGRASCPFVSPEGCLVYDSRPGACRTYPVGRGVTIAPDGQKKEIYVLVAEKHCHGFDEPEQFSVAEWFSNQGLAEYNAMNDEVMTLLHHEKTRQGITLTTEQIEAFFLALYILDEFRKQVNDPGYKIRLTLTEEECQAALADEVSLLRFGIHWLKKEFFDDKS